MSSDREVQRYDVEMETSQGAVIGDQPTVHQYFGYQGAALGGAVSYWLGRPATLGSGLVGRQTDLDGISAAFNGKRAVVISGGAGCGKSRLAGSLGIKSGSDADIALEVRRSLAGLTPETIWVVDNFSDLDQLNALLSDAGPVRLVLTTRDSRDYLLPGNVAFVPLEVIDTSPAIDLLCSRSSCDPASPELSDIVEAVGRLPLALEMLAVRLGMPGQTPERLLADLRKAPTPIQYERFQSAEGATIPRPEGVFATIAGVLADLSEDLRNAVSGLGYVADAPVPLTLLTALTGLDEPGMDRLYRECGRRSVFSVTGDQATVHALTASALRATNEDNSIETVLRRVWDRLNSISTDDPVAMRAEISHYERLHSLARGTMVSDDYSVLGFTNNLAIGYRALGRNEEAVALDQETLKGKERVLGPEHPDTLRSRQGLAIGYWALGRNEEAVALDEETLKIRERMLGPEHPSTLNSRNNLAGDYRVLGRNEEAVALDQETLKMRERV